MKNFKRVIAMTIVAVMVMALVPFSVSAASTWTGAAASSFESGTGTEADPYLIANANQLAYLATLSREDQAACTGKYFKLTADIDLANLDWTPIGNSDLPFGGYFDGDNHTITGLHVNTTESHAGLFGKASGTVIKNLTVSGTLVNSASYSGAIAGLVCNSSSIINCHSDVDLIVAENAKEGGSTGLGGIVGRCEKTGNDGDYNVIANCTTSSTIGKVTNIIGKNAFIGGVVGVAGATVIIGCRSTGDVMGQATNNICCVGGILGCMGASNGEVILLLNSSSGKLIAYRGEKSEGVYTDHAYAGGIVGRVGHVSGGMILGNFSNAESYTYNDGTETAVENRTGGLFGYIKDRVDAIYNYSVVEPLVGEDSTNKFPEDGAIKTTESILCGSDVFTETKIPDTAIKAATLLVEASVNLMSVKVDDDTVAKLNTALGCENVFEYIAEQMLTEYSVDKSMALAETDILGGMPVAVSVENSLAFAKCAEALLNDACEKYDALVDEKIAPDETTQDPGDETTQEPGDETTKDPDGEATKKPDDATTKAPDQTKEPDQTEEPANNNGCKSVVVSGVAVVVMAAAAVVALKKKD